MVNGRVFQKTRTRTRSKIETLKSEVGTSVLVIGAGSVSDFGFRVSGILIFSRVFGPWVTHSTVIKNRNIKPGIVFPKNEIVK